MIPLPPEQRPARLRVGAVGAGRVGAVLAAALSRAGHHAVAVAAVSAASRRRAADLVPAATVVDPPAVTGLVDLLLLAVPDDALAGLVDGLAASATLRSGTLVAHTSGAHGIDVLAPLVAQGALPLALHPVMTFTGTDVDLQRLDGACFGVTTTDQLRPVAEALVIEMGGEPVWIDAAERGLYHAALAYGANNLTTLVAQSAELLSRAGVEHPQRMLGPLLGAAMDNALRHGDAALTGPVARGDAGTVATHLAALADHDLQIVPSYVALSRLTALRALANGTLDTTAAERLLVVLASGSG